MFLFLLVLVSSAMASPPSGHGDGPVCGPHTDLNEAPSTLYGVTPHDEYAGSDSVHSNPNPSLRSENSVHPAPAPPLPDFPHEALLLLATVACCCCSVAAAELLLLSVAAAD